MATPAVSRSLGSTGYRQISIPLKSAEQQSLINQGLGGVQQHLGGALNNIGQMAAGGSPEQWAQLEAPALRQFQDLIGGIGARFSGLGMGAQKSSAFQNALGGAGADLAERLQANRLNLQRLAQSQLMDLYSGLINQNPYESFLIEKERKNRWGGLLSGLTSGALAGSAFGPWGTAAGSLVGGLGGYFGGS